MPSPAKSPLAYLGVKSPNPPHVILAQRAPTIHDVNHDLSTVWINKPTKQGWMLTSITAGVPYWLELGADPSSNYVVDTNDATAFQTVQAAINAIQTAGIHGVVYCRPGTYTEDLTLYDGIMIQGAGLETIITGVHTPPTSGTITFYDATLTSATDIVTSAAAGTTTILFHNCLINCTDGYTADLDAWTGTITLAQCAEASTANGVINNTGGATISLWDTVCGAGTTRDFTLDDGALTMLSTRMVCQAALGGSTTISATMGCSFGGTVTTAGTVAGNINCGTFSTGATAALSQGSAGQINLSQITIDSSNDPAIAGAGAGGLMLADIEFLDGSNLAATLTLVDTNEKRLSKIMAGDATYRGTTFTAAGARIQAYASDTTATGAASNNALLGDLSVTSGDGSHTPSAIEGRVNAASGSNVLQPIGVYGLSTQTDGSTIASTTAGVEGHLNVLETDAADLPQVYAFGVKGYLDATDTTATPAAGIFAGVGSIVEYNTPFNATALGFAASRLDAGAGAGTAGAAAFGVVQGTVAAADWLYGLDLYNGAAGVAYTTADIRLWNQSTLSGTAASIIFDAAAGINYRNVLGDAVGTNYFSWEDSGNNEVAAINSRGDITGRNINVTNTNITSFNVDPILQSNATTGAAPTGATGDYNIMYCQDGVTMKQFILGAGQTIIAPRLANDGLLISLDLSTSEGAEYYFGHTTRSIHTFTIGTSAAFFAEAKFKVADCGTSDPLWLGCRILGAPNAAFANYTDAGVIGLHNTTNADTVIVGSNLNAAGWAYVNTTDAWVDGGVHTLRMNVSAAGVVTYLIDGAAPSVTQALTLDDGDVVIPFIHHLFAAAGVPAAIHLQNIACGLQ